MKPNLAHRQLEQEETTFQKRSIALHFEFMLKHDEFNFETNHFYLLNRTRLVR